MKATTVILKRGKERSLQRRHPWIFSGAIHQVGDEVTEGGVVEVLDHNKTLLGRGHYAGGSLAVKMLTFTDEPIDKAWFTKRLSAAMALRVDLGLPSESTNAYRLVHGEGDALPGLIIDVYDDVAVIQPHSLGMELQLDLLVEILRSMGFAHVVHKPVGKRGAKVLHGKVSERTEVKEYGAKYHVDILSGQKTGFFIDQRENRRLLGSYVQGKKVLNVFSYTGGFSVSAGVHGAASVTSIDASQPALDLALENGLLNDIGEIHQVLKMDAVPYMESGEWQADVVVLDPPAFAKHKSARHSAIQAYRRINEAAIKKLPVGGLLFTFSCSQVVDRHMFDTMVLSAAVNAGRQVQVLHKLRQPADHPISLAHPEGEYLKGLVVRILD